jgi:hypothetical protein
MLTLTALATTLLLVAPLQNTPRAEKKQARADRKMERAHTIRHGESLSRAPKLIRQEDKRDHRKNAKPAY